VVAQRVHAAWRRQVERQGVGNAELQGALGADAGLPVRLGGLLQQRGRRFGLSPRRLHRVARMARTIADLSGSDEIRQADLDEALAYRPERAA